LVAGQNLRLIFSPIYSSSKPANRLKNFSQSGIAFGGAWSWRRPD
jgi:hypothetical protein